MDTDALILMEKRPMEFDLTHWAELGEACTTTITCSELLAGAYRADNAERLRRRLGYLEALFQHLRILPFDLGIARTHAKLVAAMPKNLTLGAHDLLIGAAALHHGMPLLTGNVKDFSRIPGLKIIDVRSQKRGVD